METNERRLTPNKVLQRYQFLPGVSSHGGRLEKTEEAAYHLKLQGLLTKDLTRVSHSHQEPKNGEGVTRYLAHRYLAYSLP